VPDFHRLPKLAPTGVVYRAEGTPSQALKRCISDDIDGNRTSEPEAFGDETGAKFASGRPARSMTRCYEASERRSKETNTS
jgi:hypothetical protein